MLRRILLVLSVAAITVSMMVFSAVPAFAQECEDKEDENEFKSECGPFEFKIEENEGKFEGKLEFPGCELKGEQGEEPKEECFAF